MQKQNSKMKKPKMRMFSGLITIDQYEWLRKEAFLKRKSMSGIFRDCINAYRQIDEFNKVTEKNKKAKKDAS